MTWRPILITLLVLLGAGGSVAYVWIGGRPQATPTMVEGVLVDVRASSMVYAEEVSVRDSQGRIWTFDVSPAVMHDPEKRQSASHLRQHMAAADPVRVFYEEAEIRPLAVRILDGAGR